CKHGHDIHGGVIRLSLLRAPTHPDPKADQGSHRFTYALMPHLGDWREAAVIQAAEDLNTPLRVVPASLPVGTSRSLIEIDSRQAHAEDLQALSFSMKVALVAASDDWIGQGYASPIEWVRRDCRMTAGDVADRMCVGAQAAAIDESMDALIAGDIGFAHLVVIARTAEALRESKTSKGFDEQRLLERARIEDSLTRFNNYCMHYRHAQDPEGYADEERDDFENRKLKMSSGKQGMVHISAWLD